MKTDVMKAGEDGGEKQCRRDMMDVEFIVTIVILLICCDPCLLSCSLCVS